MEKENRSLVSRVVDVAVGIGVGACIATAMYNVKLNEVHKSYKQASHKSITEDFPNGYILELKNGKKVRVQSYSWGSKRGALIGTKIKYKSDVSKVFK